LTLAGGIFHAERSLGGGGPSDVFRCSPRSWAFFFGPRRMRIAGDLRASGAGLLLIRWPRAGQPHPRVRASCCCCWLAIRRSAMWLLLSLFRAVFRHGSSTAVTRTGIIVLGGRHRFGKPPGRASCPWRTDSSAERLIAMLELARRFPKARIVFSGGSGKPDRRIRFRRRRWPANCWDRFGIAPRACRSGRQIGAPTEENAVFTRQLVRAESRGERWLLVTSAFHMPTIDRRVSRRRLSRVEAYPVDWRTRGWGRRRHAIRQTERGARPPPTLPSTNGPA